MKNLDKSNIYIAVAAVALVAGAAVASYSLTRLYWPCVVVGGPGVTRTVEVPCAELETQDCTEQSSPRLGLGYIEQLPSSLNGWVYGYNRDADYIIAYPAGWDYYPTPESDQIVEPFRAEHVLRESHEGRWLRITPNQSIMAHTDDEVVSVRAANASIVTKGSPIEGAASKLYRVLVEKGAVDNAGNTVAKEKLFIYVSDDLVYSVEGGTSAGGYDIGDDSLLLEILKTVRPL